MGKEGRPQKAAHISRAHASRRGAAGRLCNKSQQQFGHGPFSADLCPDQNIGHSNIHLTSEYFRIHHSQISVSLLLAILRHTRACYSFTLLE